jgi:hypothetical protein
MEVVMHKTIMKFRVLIGLLLLFTLAQIDSQPATGLVADGLLREPPDQVLEWNQLFIDTLIATNTPNSSSQRLAAIVHTAIFDAYTGIERRYTPIYVTGEAPKGASRQAAIIAAAYTALADLFPTRPPQLYSNYVASLGALSDDDGDGGKSRERGVAWGIYVATEVLAWRAGDGFSTPRPAFTGGTTIGQWRPTLTLSATPVPCGSSASLPNGSMSAQSLAFTSMFVVPSNSTFRPPPPRGLTDPTYTIDFNAVKSLGRGTGSSRTAEQTALAPFWEGNASVHWNQAANQLAQANNLSLSENNRLFAVLNIAMADTAFTTWAAKRNYGADPTVVTWRPYTAILNAGLDGNPDTELDPDWRPLITTPCHPEYPAGHPSLNGAAATILLNRFGDSGAFTLTTPGLPERTYSSVTQAREDGNNARVWGGMHYPSSVAISDSVGADIATYVDQASMQRFNADDLDQ